jgi:hypothetical protein
MVDSVQALNELCREEQGLEIACRALAGHAPGLPLGQIERFAAEHEQAADWLAELRGEPPPALPSVPWFDRASTLTAVLRGTAAIVAFLDEREHALMHRYCRLLPRVTDEQRLAIEHRLVPQAMARLAVLDRLREMSEESWLSA